ncbi:tetratricopeptide repeat protein [Marinilactibacillus psychrotolerans]|uniref:hypothetical protein n=1 Tax=Marinilactibacillus psychrotolerans TaxID=191770 RepID=UPI00381959A9
MKIKHKYIFLYTTIQLILLLGGCAAEVNNKAYDEAIGNGLEELRIESYEKAEEYFKIALEEEPKDVRAETLLNQTQSSVDALNLFEKEQYDEAFEKAELVQSAENGSGYLESKMSNLMDEITSIRDEKGVAEQKEKSQKELFEDFKGSYATFSGENYEWPIDFLFIIADDFVISGYKQTGLYSSEIVNKTFDGNTLIIDTYAKEKPSNKEEHYMIDISFNDNNEKYIQFETDERLYPITVDDVVETGAGLLNDSFNVLDGLRTYDERAKQTVSYSNTSFLKDYSAKKIEFARVWLNTIKNEEVTELNIYEEKAGTIINPYDDNSPVYPEDVKVINGAATADGMVVYSGNGDGTIDIYPVPSHWHATPEELPEIYKEILNPTTIYLETMKDEQVIDLIQKMNIHY